MSVYWQGDGITLYHGDCRELTAWLEADVLVTDPPYGINHSAWLGNAPDIAGETRTGRASDRVLTGEHVAVRNDALALWLPKPALVFGSWRAPRPIGTRMRMVWDKGHFGLGGVGAWSQSDEEIYIVGNWPNPKGNKSVTRKPSVIRSRQDLSGDRPNHPTPKPVGLMTLLLSDCPPGKIADPFAGSGSTLIAAKLQGRKAIGVELEEKYCEIAARRLDQGVMEFPV